MRINWNETTEEQLFDWLDGFQAWDEQCKSSGIKGDGGLRDSVRDYLNYLHNDCPNAYSRTVFEFIKARRMEGGNAVEDVVCFLEWFRDFLGVDEL